MSLFTRKIKKQIGVALIGACLAGCFIPAVAQAAPSATDPVPVHIFTFNDFHGRIEGSDVPVNVAQNTGPTTLPFMSTLQTAALADPANSMVVSAGDNIGASLFTSAIAQDEPTIQVLNDLAATPGINFKASSVGNHEFDQGLADLQDRVIGSNGSGLVQGWEYLGANVVSRATGEPVLKPYTIYTLGNGLTVGVVTAVTQETPSLVSPAGIADVSFTDPVAAVNTYADRLKDGDASNGEADLVLAVYHEGASNPTSLDAAMAASQTFTHLVNDTDAKVDAIVNGHTHQKYAWTGADGQDSSNLDTHQGRPIVQAASYGTAVGQIDLKVDPVTKKVLDTSVSTLAVNKVAPVDLGVGSLQTISDHVEAAIAHGAVLGKPTVAGISSDITTAWTGGEWVDGTYQDTGAGVGGSSERANESALATLGADSFLDTANASTVIGGADIGIINAGGGLRADLLFGDDGVISYAEANAVMPFSNNLWTIELTGAQIKQFLEEQWQTEADGVTRPARAFLYTGLSSNVTYTVNTDQVNAEPCSLETNCSWNDPRSHVTSVTVNGQPLDPERTYKIITLSFLISGGDKYRVMTQGTNATDTGLLDRDAWINYLEKLSGVTAPGGTPTTQIAPSFARTSVVVSNLSYLDPTGAAAAPMGHVTLAGGTSLTAALSRLDLTSLGSPANTTLDTYLAPATTAGQAAAAQTVKVATTTVTAPGDQAGCAAAGVPGDLNSFSASEAVAPGSNGCAKLDVTIPADTAPGEYVLTAVAMPSGTTVTIPLTVVAAAPQPTPTVSPSASAPAGHDGASAATGGQVMASSWPTWGWAPLLLVAALVLGAGAYRLVRK